MAEDKAAPKKLFDDCVFVFVETNSLSKDVIQAVGSLGDRFRRWRERC